MAEGPTLTGTLVDFLRARIDEDATAARAAYTDAMSGWQWKHLPEPAYAVIQTLTLESARRTLAECEAKRALLALRENLDQEARVAALTDPDTAREARSARSGVDAALLALTTVYADHPDYRPEWLP